MKRMVGRVKMECNRKRGIKAKKTAHLEKISSLDPLAETVDGGPGFTLGCHRDKTGPSWIDIIPMASG